MRLQGCVSIIGTVVLLVGYTGIVARHSYPPCCPNCGSLIDLTELWKAAPKSVNTIIDRVAIACPVCGVKLRVLQSRASVTRFLAFLVPSALMVIFIFVAPVTRGSSDYKIRMGIFVVVLLGTVFLQRRNNPRLLTVRLLQNNEKVRYPLARSSIPNPEDGAARKSRAVQLEPTEDDRPSWVCAKCGAGPREYNAGSVAGIMAQGGLSRTLSLLRRITSRRVARSCL